MEGIKNLNLNVHVTLFAPDSVDDSSHILKGRIYNRESDQNIIIELESGSSYAYLTSGKQILLFLAHDLGLYIFSATVREVKMEGDRHVVHCHAPKQLRYFQRRKNVRVSINIPVSFSAEFNRSRVWDGSIIDISVGGMQIEAPFLIPVDSVLELVFQLEDVGPMFMDGKVVRAFTRGDKFIHGIEFCNVDQMCIDGIARFIMAEQMRQKRLGLNVFKAFILNATVAAQNPSIFSIIQYKDMDVTALQGKKCNGTVVEIGINDLSIESALKLPLGAVLEFSLEMPKLGYTVLQARVKEVTTRNGKYLLRAEYTNSYEGIRDNVLQLLAQDFKVPYLAEAANST